MWLPPYQIMSDTWKRRGIIQYVEFVTGWTIDKLRISDAETRKLFLNNIFTREELPPRQPAELAESPEVSGTSPTNTVQDLITDSESMDKLVEILGRYLLAGEPQLPVRETATNLLRSTKWPSPWQDYRISALSDDAEAIARDLINYAIGQTNLPPPDTNQSALGALLEPIMDYLGGEDLADVQRLIKDYHL